MAKSRALHQQDVSEKNQITEGEHRAIKLVEKFIPFLGGSLVFLGAIIAVSIRTLTGLSILLLIIILILLVASFMLSGMAYLKNNERLASISINLTYLYLGLLVFYILVFIFSIYNINIGVTPSENLSSFIN